MALLASEVKLRLGDDYVVGATYVGIDLDSNRKTYRLVIGNSRFLISKVKEEPNGDSVISYRTRGELRHSKISPSPFA